MEENLTSSGAFLIKNLLSRVIDAPTLNIVSSANHEIRLLHLTKLKEDAKIISISAKKRENRSEFLRNFCTPQFYNTPNFMTDQNYSALLIDHRKDSDDDGSDDEIFIDSCESMGWKFSKYLFDLSDRAPVTNILNIIVANPAFTPEAWYDYAMRLLWASLPNPEIKALLDAMLGQDCK